MWIEREMSETLKEICATFPVRIEKLRDFYGPKMIRNAYIACTTEQVFKISPQVEARSGMCTWEI